jgi:hypothetical protein
MVCQSLIMTIGGHRYCVKYCNGYFLKEAKNGYGYIATIIGLVISLPLPVFPSLPLLYRYQTHWL